MRNVFNFMGVMLLAVILFFTMSIIVVFVCVAANGGHLNFSSDNMTSVETIAFHLGALLMSMVSVAISNRIINGEWVIE